MKSSRLLCALLTLVAWLPAPTWAAELEPLLSALQSVGPQGAGSRQAADAWNELVKADVAQLPVILGALDGAGPLAANWIRAAVDAIAEQKLNRGGKLPADKLEQFVLDTKHAPRARRLAYEWLLRVDPKACDRLLPGALDDPSLEMRRDAVARLIDRAVKTAEKGQAADVVPIYHRALGAARDLDQIKLLTQRLRKLGQKVDLPRHFGFLVRWKLIGPFDNTDEKGYHVVYPPEQKIDLAAPCQGKHGPVKWIDYVTKHDYGLVDLNKGLAEEKEVVGYGTTAFVSEKKRDVEFRVTSFNAVKLWLNGKLIDEHNVYHGGSQMDQYVSRATLQPGRNTILIKVCQNAQTQSWANKWGFQMRVCDASGTAVLSTDRDRQKGDSRGNDAGR